MIRLLFDHMLSPKLTRRLDDIFPDSMHIYRLKMHTEDDKVVWNYALTNGYVIVTLDADYSDLSRVKGFPPNVVWLRCGNSATTTVENILRNNQEHIKRLVDDEDYGLLLLW